jgi:hypothetical protein
MGIEFCTCATGWWWTAFPFIEMQRVWQGVKRILFWSYERGSWPYDVIVVLIVIFVLATPAKWFHDRPQAVALASTEVQLVSDDAASGTSTYRLDAALLPAEKRTAHATPELERETHDILWRAVEALKGQTFQVRRIEPVRGDDGSVEYYDVTIQPSSMLSDR